MWKGILVGAGFLFLLSSIALPWQITLPDQIVLPAGKAQEIVSFQFSNLWNRPLTGRAFELRVSDPALVDVTALDEAVSVQSRFLEGEGVIEIRAFPVRGELFYQVRPDYRDRDGDGFPDVAKLHSESDRRLFRERFVALARSQLAVKSPVWRERDCSGLVRFAYREALKQHDREWHTRIASPVASHPDLQAFHYPRIPVLRDRLFRIRPGRFSPQTIEQDFSAFASAFYLLSYNTVPIGKQEKRAQPGDLLFFHQPLFFQFPYHVMIYAGAGTVIYHTGPVEGDEGRLVESTLQELSRHPDPRWRPVRENPAFLGFYRWKILN